MYSSNFDPVSLIFLLIGKENSWIPIIFGIIFIIQKWKDITKLYNSIHSFGKAQYTVHADIYINIEDDYTYGTIDNNVWGLIMYINNIIKHNKHLISNTRTIKLPYSACFEENESIILPNSNAVINLTDDIKCSITMSHDKRESQNKGNSKQIDVSTINFTLYSDKSINTIIEFMKKNSIEYDEYMKKKSNNDLLIIKPSFKKDYIPRYTKFNTTKSFDNLFFEQKDELINRLNLFINREKYKILGLPETLGLLFYGEPGTGKTSCIKAIAKYLNMNLIIIPMNNIKTKKQLEDIFFDSTCHIEQNKRIYIFEEVDCNGWDKIVCKRKNGNEDKKDDIMINNDTIVIDTLTNALGVSKKKEPEPEDPLTLGGLLEIIDGIIECPGRVIIMTTNHKDNIDPALLRPGRIDMEIEFKRLRNIDIAKIYQKWYGAILDENIINNIPNYKYTQAEISQLLFKYENNPLMFQSVIQNIV